MQPERPPPPLIPKTDDERKILRLAEAFVTANEIRIGCKMDLHIPTRIAAHPFKAGCAIVECWTPRRELELLGPRALIVNANNKTVEFAMRD